MAATVRQVQTRNLVGILPGKSDELMVLASYTDGTNGLENNGPNCIVDMAQYLARLPQDSLPRSVMLLLTGGRLAGGAGIAQFMDRHKDDGLTQRMAATDGGVLRHAQAGQCGTRVRAAACQCRRRWQCAEGRLARCRPDVAGCATPTHDKLCQGADLPVQLWYRHGDPGGLPADSTRNRGLDADAAGSVARAVCRFAQGNSAVAVARVLRPSPPCSRRS